MTRNTNQKIIYIYSCVSNDIKSHTHDRKYFLGLSLTRNQREACTIHLVKKVREIWRYSCWEKGNFILICEFKFGQTWKIWPSTLSLSFYNTFNSRKVHWKSSQKNFFSKRSCSSCESNLKTLVKYFGRIKYDKIW